MTSEDQARGWFADVDTNQTGEYVWQPCLETGRGHIPCFATWFKTKAECEEWIAENVLGVGWHRGEPTVEPAHMCGPHEPDHCNPHVWDAATCPPKTPARKEPHHGV